MSSRRGNCWRAMLTWARRGYTSSISMARATVNLPTAPPLLRSRRSARCKCKCGGLRSDAVVDDLLRVGVDRLVIGSAAVEQTELTSQWLTRHGAERICLAFDVKHASNGVPLIYTRGWTHRTELTLWDAVARYHALGLTHVLCTDIDRDGALAGPNVALYAEALRRFPAIAWQASGGIRDVLDLKALATLGCAAAISGTALLEQRMTASELAPYLPRAAIK